MKWRRAIASLLVFLAAASFLGYATWRGNFKRLTGHIEIAERMRNFYELRARDSAVMWVTSRNKQLRVHTLLAGQPQEVKDAKEIDYGFEIRWFDNMGRKVHTAIFREKSSFDVPNLLGGPLYEIYKAKQHIVGDRRELAAERITIIPVQELLPQGGKIVITPRTGNLSLLMRAFVLRARDVITIERLARSPSLKLRQSVERRAGMPKWDLLGSEERRLILEDAWTRIEIRSTSRIPLPSRRVTMQDELVEESRYEQRQAAAHKLYPGQSLALDIEGPAKLIVVAEPGSIEALSSWTISEDTGKRRDVTLEPTSDYRFFVGPGQKPWLMPVKTVGPITLNVTNNADHPAVFFLLATQNASERWHDTVASIALNQITPDDSVESESLAVVGPRLVFFDGYRVSHAASHAVIYSMAGLSKYGVLRLSIRTVGRAQRNGGAPVPKASSAEIATLDHKGKVLWKKKVEVATQWSRYERVWKSRNVVLPGSKEARADAKLMVNCKTCWMGEPDAFYVSGGATMEAVSVRSDDDVIVTGSYEGPVEPDKHETAEVDIIERFRERYERRWRTIPASNHRVLIASEQVDQIAAQRRLEPRTPEDLLEAAQRQYESVAPFGVSRDFGEIWLIPIVTEGEQLSPMRPAALYCEIEPGPRCGRFSYASLAQQELNYRMFGLLWVPSRHIGQSYEVAFDKKPWRDGRIHQTLTAVRGERESVHGCARLTAPFGARLWLRNFGNNTVCERPFRPRVAYRIAPKQRLRFRLIKRMDKQIIVVGGISDGGPVPLEMRIIHNPARSHLGTARTRLLRTLTLHPQTDINHQITKVHTLRNPTYKSQLHTNAGFMLQNDLPPGTYDMWFTNIGKHVVRVWVLEETKQPTARDIDSSATIGWIRQNQ